MATTATLLQAAIYKATQSDMFQSNEVRASNYGAWEAAWGDRELLAGTSQLEAIKKSSVQTTTLDVFVKEAQGEGTARKCSPTGGQTTDTVDLTYATIFEEFSLSELEYLQNRFSKEDAMAHMLQQKLLSIDKRLDTAAVAFLESSYHKGDGSIYPNFNQAKQVPPSDYDIQTQRAALWLNNVAVEMEENDYYGQIRVVGSPRLKGYMASMLNQGAGTATNLGFQFQNFNAMFSNRVTNNTGRNATAYVFEKGMVGAVTWANGLHRKGKDIGTDVWTIMQHPRYGFDIEVKIKKACTDNSGTITGGQADYVEGIGLSFDVAFFKAYSSVANNTGLYKYELDAGGNIQSGSSGEYSATE